MGLRQMSNQFKELLIMLQKHEEAKRDENLDEMLSVGDDIISKLDSIIKKFSDYREELMSEEYMVKIYNKLYKDTHTYKNYKLWASLCPNFELDVDKETGKISISKSQENLKNSYAQAFVSLQREANDTIDDMNLFKD